MKKVQEIIFRIEKFIEFIRNIFYIGGRSRLFLHIIFVFLIDLLMFFILFKKEGFLYTLELSNKIPVITMVATQSLSFICLVYFRYKDERKEFSVLKLEIYKELLSMVYENYEIINTHFISHIDKFSNKQTKVKSPVYKIWFDIKQDYRGLFVDCLINDYMKEIFSKFDEYFEYYQKAKEEIKMKIESNLHKYRKEALLVDNYAEILYDKVYRNEQIKINDITTTLTIVSKEDSEELIIDMKRVVSSNANYVNMVSTYENLKKLHRDLLFCIQNRILNYYY